MFSPKEYPILAVTNRHLCRGDFLAQIERVARFGAAGILLREKDLSEREYETLARQVLAVCSREGVPCILHNFVDPARRLYREMEAFGFQEEMIHTEQRESAGVLPFWTSDKKNAPVRAIHLSIGTLREWSGNLSDFSVVGVSIHSAEEAMEAESLGASYLTAGHIFATDCKKGVPPKGLSFLEEVVKCTSIPVLAIGGITPENATEAMNAGAKGVCVMSGMMRLH